MLIEPHAFYNCLSLRTIDFTACDKAVSSGLYQDNIDLSQVNIIVKDEQYEQQKKIESPFVNIIKQSDIDSKKSSTIENDIAESINNLEIAKNYILDADIQKAIACILAFLKSKYNINEEKYKLLGNK